MSATQASSKIPLPRPRNSEVCKVEGGGGGHQKAYSVFATQSSSKSQPSEETVMCVKCGG